MPKFFTKTNPIAQSSLRYNLRSRRFPPISIASCWSDPGLNRISSRNRSLRYTTFHRIPSLFQHLQFCSYAVLLIEKKDQEGQSQVLSAALEIAEAVNLETDTKFRDLVAIGSLMLEEGPVKKIALDFDVGNIAKAAKASKEAKIAEVGADIDILIKQSWPHKK